MTNPKNVCLGSCLYTEAIHVSLKMGAVIVGAKKASHEPFFILPSASERVESKHINVLFVCDEWNSSKGGLATFNRKFAINLACEQALCLGKK